jgi:Protein of unknown function (DUF1570)
MDRIDRSSPPRLARLAGLILLATVAGCATMGNKGGKPLVPTAFQVRTGPYIICTNDKLEVDAPVVRQLRSLDAQVQETLGLKVEAGEHPVEVYILDDRKSFEHFLTFYYPDLPHRRAFFLANGEQRVVYTFFGDRLEEDIRHEATHALLHVAIGDIPLWLDEGLAEYFEGPAELKGQNPEHVGRLPGDLATGWTPDLARLESLKGVRQMTPRDYRESWAWVHFLLNEGPTRKAALLAYLADLKGSPEARPISERLEGPTAEPMLAHLARVKDEPVAVNAPKDPTVRLQSGQVDPPPAAPKRRGAFARLRDLFGP